METRTILQIILGFIVVLVLALGAYILYTFTKKAETIVVTKIIKDEGQKVEKKNPWEDKGSAAITIVKRQQIKVPASPSEEEKKDRKKKSKDEPAEETVSLGELLTREDFVTKTLKMPSGSKPKWSAEWWGETKYGPSFFLVSFSVKDANISVGPEWLVDLKKAKIVPKNVLARVAQQPVKGKQDEYYDKHQQVVSALASHRFESKLNLAGALLVYFEQREEVKEGDKILGWTIEHDRGSLFKAYFQWIEAGEPTYAEFEFDYSRKALKASNLQAANVMRIGEDFDKKDRPQIRPASYDPEAKPGKRWTGGARKACKSTKAKNKCAALAQMFQQREIVEALEWLLSAQVEDADQFEMCKRKRRCKWGSKRTDKNTYQVSYIFDLKNSGKPKRVSWNVDLKNGKIVPQDRRSQASYKAIYPREAIL